MIPDHVSPEEAELLLDEWVLVDYIDNGFTNPDTPCECGRPLRYQYIVEHKPTNETRRFGITHFEEHTGISASIVSEIKKGFNSIDYEQDELLLKIKNNWDIKEEFSFIPDDITFPEGIEKHLELDVPLLDKQIKELQRLISNHMYNTRRIDDKEKCCRTASCGRKFSV